MIYINSSHFFVLPVFAFANAGIYVLDMSSDVIFHDVSVGVALGLVIGKQLGVFSLCALAIHFGIAKCQKAWAGIRSMV